MRTAILTSLLALVLGAPVPAAEPAGSKSPTVTENPGRGGKPGGTRKVRDTVQIDAERAVCKAKNGEFRCTVVSTGSNPGPEDDTISCVCIITGPTR
jgi:hypothetical protein